MNTVVPRIAVVGSSHMDLIATADRLPALGQSVNGIGFSMSPGGKGGNQACQCARLGLETYLIAALGNDSFGESLRKSLQGWGVDLSHVQNSSEPTGASTVFSVTGEYASVICSGAASKLTVGEITHALGKIKPALVICQLELPLALTAAAISAAKEQGAKVVLNASPVLSDQHNEICTLLRRADLVIANRFEAESLTQASNPLQAAQMLCARGASLAVVTQGKGGAHAATSDKSFFQSGFNVDSVDSLGAGDAFLAAFVSQWVRGESVERCLRYACAAGALATMKRGALSAQPTAEEIDRFLATAKSSY